MISLLQTQSDFFFSLRDIPHRLVRASLPPERERKEKKKPTSQRVSTAWSPPKPSPYKDSDPHVKAISRRTCCGGTGKEAQVPGNVGGISDSTLHPTGGDVALLLPYPTRPTRITRHMGMDGRAAYKSIVDDVPAAYRIVGPPRHSCFSRMSKATYIGSMPYIHVESAAEAGAWSCQTAWVRPGGGARQRVLRCAAAMLTN